MVMKIAVLVLILGGILFFFKLKDKKQVASQAEETLHAVEMKQDSICGSFVEETTKYKVKLHGKLYYFCSEECKNKFIEENTKNS